MDDAIRAFVTFLDVERGASRETLRNYASDLRQFASFITAGTSGTRPVDPAAIQSDMVRGYLLSAARGSAKLEHPFVRFHYWRFDPEGTNSHGPEPLKKASASDPMLSILIHPNLLVPISYFRRNFHL